MNANTTPEPEEIRPETMTSFTARHGATLVDNGWSLLPIMPGKKIPGTFRNGAWENAVNWQRRCDLPATLMDVEIWSRWPGCAIGFTGGCLVGIDIDVLDEQVAHAVEQLFLAKLGPTTLRRVGRYPKRLLIYRTEKPFPGRKRHPLEVLGRGQQFLAYAIHPETGQPYYWTNDDPLTTPFEAVPLVTEAQVLAALDAAYAMVPEHLRPRTLAATGTAMSEWRGPSDPKGTRAAVEEALCYIPNDDLDGSSWAQVGMALKAALGEEGRDLWLAWSKSSSKSGASGKTGTAEKRWATFRPHSIGAGSIYWLAEQRGWIPSPELTLNAEVAEALASGAGMNLVGNLTSLTGTLAHGRASGAPLTDVTWGKRGQVSAVGGREAPPVPKANPLDRASRHKVPAGLLDLDGLLAAFVDWAVRSAISPQPFLALGAAVTMVGALAGRRYATRTDLRSNLYALGVADSGGGKDHARKLIKRALHAANLSQYIGGEDLGSSVGLLTALKIHPSRIFLLDEFGHFLAQVLGPRAPAYRAAIWTEFTKLYTSASGPYQGAEYADQSTRPRVDIQEPCACIWGTTVPGPLYQAIQNGALSDGSFARFLVFVAEEDYPDRVSRPELSASTVPPEVAAGIAEVAAGVAEIAGGVTMRRNLSDLMLAQTPANPALVSEDDAAIAALAATDRDALGYLRQHVGTYSTAPFARLGENTAKLAMLRAVSRCPASPVITGRDVEWARCLAEHCIRSLIGEADVHVSASPYEARVKQVLAVIVAAGGCTKNHILRKTQHMSRKERDEALSVLVETSQVRQTVIPGDGRPTQFFTPIEGG